MNKDIAPGPPNPQTGNSQYQQPQQFQKMPPQFQMQGQQGNQQMMQFMNQKMPPGGMPGAHQNPKMNMVAPRLPQVQGQPPQQFQGDNGEISSLIHNEYGEEFHRTQKTRSNAYQTCLFACGGLSQCICCMCVACECGPMQVIPPGNVGLLMEFGKLKKKIGPGPKFINPCTETVKIVSIRRQTKNLPAQTVLTRDQLKLTCSAGVNYDFTNVELVAFKLQDFNSYLNFTIQGELKALIAKITLEELKNNTMETNKKLREKLNEKFLPYGVTVIEVFIRNIVLPLSMQRAMATQAESKQQVEMKKNAAMGYLKSAKDYKKAAESYKGNNIAMELKYFSILQAMTIGKKSTVMMRDCIIKLKDL